MLFMNEMLRIQESKLLGLLHRLLLMVLTDLSFML